MHDKLRARNNTTLTGPPRTAGVTIATTILFTSCAHTILSTAIIIVTITRKDKTQNPRSAVRQPNAQCSPPRSAAVNTTTMVFLEIKKKYPKDGVILLLLFVVVVVSGEQTRLYRCGRGKKTDIIYRSISTQSRAHTHTLASRSAARGVCTTRGRRAPLAMVVDLYCGGVVVTVDDGFSFAAAKATKYEHTTHRRCGLSFARFEVAL